jgi:hypothetical protein
MPRAAAVVLAVKALAPANCAEIAHVFAETLVVSMARLLAPTSAVAAPALCVDDAASELEPTRAALLSRAGPIAFTATTLVPAKITAIR